MQKDNYFQLFLYCFSIVLNIFFIILIFATLSEGNKNYFFNSDNLFLPSFYRDIIINKNCLQGWNFGTCPYFFPNMFLYFIIQYIIPNFKISLMVYGIIQYLIFLVLFNYLLKIIFKEISYYPLILINLFFILFFIYSFLSNDFIFSSYFFIPLHMGAFIMCIVCLIFTFLYIRTKKLNFLSLLLIFGIISIISDKIFIVFYSIPIICVLLFIFLNKRIRLFLKLLVWEILIIIISISLYKFLKGLNLYTLSELSLLNFSNIKSSMGMLFNQYWNYLVEGNLKSFILAISLISFIITVIFLKIELKKFKNLNKVDIFTNIPFLYLSFSIIFTIIVFFSPAVNGIYFDYSGIRYNIFILYLLSGNFFIFLCYYLKIKKIFIKYASIFSLLIFSGFFVFASNKNSIKEGIKQFAKYYPNLVSCVDSIAIKNHLKFGVADYWDAKFITMFSKQDLKVFSVYYDILPYHLLNNSNSYYHSESNKNLDQWFNFIVAHPSQDTIFINSLFNKPKNIISNDGNCSIFITDEFIYTHALNAIIKKEYKSIMEIFCNFDSTTADKKFFLTNIPELLFDNLDIQNNEKSFSGKFSIKLTRDNPFACTYIEDSITIGETYKISVWIYPEDAPGTIVATTEDTKDFYLNIPSYEKTNINGWKQIALIFNTKPHLKNKILKIYLWYMGDNYCYFDDFQILKCK